MGKEINAVRYLRDKYEIMQKALICQGISRPYLSNLENGKVEISHEMAYRISEKFNEVFASKGIDVRLNKEDLMNVKRLVNKINLNDELALYERIDNIDHEEVQMLEERYLIVESPYEYARLNSLLGNYYYYKNERQKALRYLVKAFDAFVSNERLDDSLAILSKIIITNIDLSDLKSAKAYDDFFFSELSEHHEKLDMRLKEKFYFNSALLNKKLGNYDLAHERLDTLGEFGSRRAQRNEFAEILRANIYRAEVNLDGAEKVLRDLLMTTNDGLVRIYGSITLLEVLTDKKDAVEFNKLARSLMHMLKDQKSETSEYVAFYMTVLKLSDEIGDSEFFVDHVKETAAAVKARGSKSDMEELIVLMKPYSKSCDKVSDIMSKLVDAYFKF